MSHTFYATLYYALTPEVAKTIVTKPSQLKKMLNLNFDDEILPHTMSVVEDKLKININVKNEYESDKTYLRTINMKFDGTRWSYLPNSSTAKELFSFRDFNRRFTYFQHVYEPNTFTVASIRTYDGTNLQVIPVTDFKPTKSKTHSYKSIRSGANIVETYQQFVQLSKHLKELTNIDLKKTDYSITDCALQLFYSYGRVFVFEQMEEDETTWILNTKRCGLIYCEPAMGEMNEFDVNSQYPSIMCSNQGLPYGKPEFHTIETIPDFWKFGIYRATITNVDKRLFLTNKMNYYTHVDLKRALELGATVELILDEKPNAMLYPKRIIAKTLFEPFVKNLFQYKKQNKLVKSIINRLWGALCEKDTQILNDSNDLDLEGARQVKIIEGIDGSYKYNVLWGFKRPHARIGPFLTAYGRTMISKIAEPIIDEVFKIHTDGILTTSDVISTSNQLGEMKLEKSGSFNIININNVQYLPFINEIKSLSEKVIKN